jgi:hypothetical protein
VSAAIVYLLFAISGGNAPDLSALASYPSQPACRAALETVGGALAEGDNGVHLLCIASDSLEELGQKSGASGN